MATHKIVYKQTGENQGTRSPICALADFDGDMDATTSVCINSGMDMLITVKVYIVKEITLPDTITVDFWLKNHIQLKYVYGAGVPETTSLTLVRWLMDADMTTRVVVGKLLKTKKFRSAFRQSLRDQLDDWAAQETPEYAAPLTGRQLAAATHDRDRIEAKNTATRLYWTR